MGRRDIERMVHELVNDWWDNMAVGHPDEITVEWLMQQHPELDAEEAELYRQFCKRNTIVFIGCYGDGSVMWPLWQAFKAEISSL